MSTICIFCSIWVHKHIRQTPSAAAVNHAVFDAASGRVNYPDECDANQSVHSARRFSTSMEVRAL